MPAKCPQCGGMCRVDSSKRAGTVQVQYVQCVACRARRRQVVPASAVWRRSK
jgi:hypothetical protein